MIPSTPTALVVGLGHVGFCCADALLRAGTPVIAADFKTVHERTLERAYGVPDLGLPKVAALAEHARRTGRGHLLRAVNGRFEESVGAGDLMAVTRALLCADRPSALRRAWEILVQTGNPQGLMTTVNVGMNAAQVRAFSLDGTGPCPFCGTSDRYLATSYADLGVSCEDATAAPAGGDRYSVPYGMHESFSAAGMALSGMVAPGQDATVSLCAPGHLLVSALAKDPDCPVCSPATNRWPQVSLEIRADAPLHEAPGACRRFRPTGELFARFLRPIAEGTHCSCGRQPGLRQLMVDCPECGGRVAPLRGCGFEIPLSELARQGCTAQSLGLPPRDLVLLHDHAGDAVTILVTEGDGCEAITGQS